LPNFLTRADWHCEATGAQVMRAPRGLLYEAPIALHKALQPRRGGVPVLFPQFNLSGSFDKHGFARVMPWRLIRDDIEFDSNNSAVGHWMAELNACPERVAEYASSASTVWAHHATLKLQATFTAATMKIMLTVTNVGATTFQFTGGLHPYFAWDHDQALIPELGISLTRSEMLLSGLGVERCLQAPSVLTLQMNTGADEKILTIERFGFHEWMLWNPGPKHTLTDIETDDWRRFICLEPISVNTPHVLTPGQQFSGGFSVR
jgi:glucose-6-phosphate 1-epimerase